LQGERASRPQFADFPRDLSFPKNPDPFHKIVPCAHDGVKKLIPLWQNRAPVARRCNLGVVTLSACLSRVCWMICRSFAFRALALARSRSARNVWRNLKKLSDAAQCLRCGLPIAQEGSPCPHCKGAGVAHYCSASHSPSSWPAHWSNAESNKRAASSINPPRPFPCRAIG
jgi:hypothetical protein